MLRIGISSQDLEEGREKQSRIKNQVRFQLDILFSYRVCDERLDQEEDTHHITQPVTSRLQKRKTQTSKKGFLDFIPLCDFILFFFSRHPNTHSHNTPQGKRFDLWINLDCIICEVKAK